VALYPLLKPVGALWYLYRLNRMPETPRPLDSAKVSAPGPHPMRILLLSDGTARGWGVATHQLAMTGHLARSIALATGRGCEVEFVGDEVLNAASAPSWLRLVNLDDFDAVVTVVGLTDTVRFTSETRWRATFDALLDQVTFGGKPTLVVGIPPVRSIPDYDGPLGVIADGYARRLNSHIAELVAERSTAAMVELERPVRDATTPSRASEAYRAWAQVIATAIVPLLPEPAPVVRTDSRPVDAERWPGMDAARQLAEDASEALRAISAAAKRRFMVPVATVSLLDGDRVAYLDPGMTDEVPAEMTHCAIVAETDAPLVVGDNRRDERFRDNPILRTTMMNLYAGHPIVSSSGQPIGSFCLMSPIPRRESAIDLEELRDFALQAQAELWKLEAAARAQLPADDRISDLIDTRE
jgi:hypothetical protein